jgi:hypothetical protein
VCLEYFVAFRVRRPSRIVRVCRPGDGRGARPGPAQPSVTRSTRCAVVIESASELVTLTRCLTHTREAGPLLKRLRGPAGPTAAVVISIIAGSNYYPRSPTVAVGAARAMAVPRRPGGGAAHRSFEGSVEGPGPPRATTPQCRRQGR